MSDLKEKFDKAAADVTKLSSKPDNSTLLQLYSLFKQAENGDVTGKRPGMLNMVGRAKYDAWAKLKGTPQETATQNYIDLVERLKGA